jgi:hypothetical protein
MNGNSVKTMRYLFFGVSLVGGLILLAAGQTLIGGLLVAMGAVRIVLLISMQRRMGSSSQARGGSNSPRGGPQMLRRLAGMELDVAATSIGVAPDVLRRAVDEGRSIAALAADAGVPADRVVDAVVRDANTKVDRAVADGRIAPDRATLLRGRLPNWAEQLVTQTPKMLAGTGSGPA